jgi:hypothetical protein
MITAAKIAVASTNGHHPTTLVQMQPCLPHAAPPALRRIFLDEGEWKRLTKEAGIWLPQ